MAWLTCRMPREDSGRKGSLKTTVYRRTEPTLWTVQAAFCVISVTRLGYIFARVPSSLSSDHVWAHWIFIYSVLTEHVCTFPRVACTVMDPERSRFESLRRI